VRKDAEFRAAQAGGVDDRSVNEFVEHDRVAAFHQRGDGSEGGGVTAGKTQRGFGAFEIGEDFLEFVMRRERTGHEPRRAGAGAELRDRPRGASRSAASLNGPRYRWKRWAGFALRARAALRIDAPEFAVKSGRANHRDASSTVIEETIGVNGDLRFGIYERKAV
jgi:hypothetical protein